ncbi:MAG: FdtA/QdtA family cupin domain-containing protein [Candidatus Omnitrophota bacterium]|jgi:dTDP-4-dehydrorhamnose 3,5-epimerase-like enzyme
MKSFYRKIELKFIDDGVDGNLVVAEAQNQVPFKIKRVYFINNLSHLGAVRGKHAHKKLEQAIFCVNGSFKLGLDDGNKKEKVALSKPYVGIYLRPGVWHTMHNFSKDCVILVLASDIYKESDYIRDHEEFLKYVKAL